MLAIDMIWIGLQSNIAVAILLWTMDVYMDWLQNWWPSTRIDQGWNWVAYVVEEEHDISGHQVLITQDFKRL
jgi:hypothetical protein